MPAEQNEIDPSNILLAVDVPESATAGSTFHVELQNRYFEVMTARSVNCRIYYAFGFRWELVRCL